MAVLEFEELNDDSEITYNSDEIVFKPNTHRTIYYQCASRANMGNKITISNTISEKPTGVNGYIRYNSHYNKFEGYENDNWKLLWVELQIKLESHILTLLNLASLDIYTSSSKRLNIDSAGKLMIGDVDSKTPNAGLEIHSSDALLLPKGTISDRPSNPINGYIRFNTSKDDYEAFSASNSIWESLGGCT